MSMKFHVFFKGYLAVMGVWGILVNLSQWLQAYAGVTLLGFVMDAADAWLPVTLVFDLALSVVGVIAAVQLWRMARSGITLVNVWLGLHILEQVVDILRALVDPWQDAFGLCMGLAVVVVLDGCIFRYYQKREELFEN